MKKVILLLLVLLLISSCQIKSCETPDQAKEFNAKQGVVDITITSLGNKEEYQGQRLELPLSIHNILGYDLENVVISVQGFDSYYVDLYSEKQEIALLEGRSIFNPDGMKQQFLFEGVVNKLLPGAEQEPEEYRVHVQYNSKVEFSPTICVTSTQGSYIGAAYDTYQGACTFEKEISYGGQGAPLAVTAMEIIPRQGRQIELRLNIENKGRGKVSGVTLAGAALGGKPLTCEFRGDSVQNSFRFEAEQKLVTLICAGYIGSDETYRTPLFVELLYDYELDQTEKLTILK